MTPRTVSPVQLFQAYIGDLQRRYVSALATPLDASDNRGEDTREYELMKAIHAGRPEDGGAWGLISWKFSHKCAVSLEQFLAFAQHEIAAGADCVFINPMLGNEAVYRNVWEQGLRAHRNLNQVCGFLQRTQGLDLGRPMGREHFAFCNYFVATPAFWSDYFRWVDDIVTELETQKARGTPVGQAYGAPAGHRDDDPTPLRPFVIERLFSTYLQTQPGLRVAAYPNREVHYARKFGRGLGRLLMQLSLRKAHGMRARSREILEDWQGQRQIVMKTFGRSIGILDDPPSLSMPVPPALRTELWRSLP